MPTARGRVSGGNCGANRRGASMKILRSGLGIILGIGAVVILAVAVGLCNLPWAARWLDVGTSPQSADVIVLLNGGVNTRPFVAAALVRGGWAPKILLNTVTAHASERSGAVPPSFVITLKALDYCNVAVDRVVILDSLAATTFDEAKA